MNGKIRAMGVEKYLTKISNSATRAIVNRVVIKTGILSGSISNRVSWTRRGSGGMVEIGDFELHKIGKNDVLHITDFVDSNRHENEENHRIRSYYVKHQESEYQIFGVAGS